MLEKNIYSLGSGWCSPPSPGLQIWSIQGSLAQKLLFVYLLRTRLCEQVPKWLLHFSDWSHWKGVCSPTRFEGCLLRHSVLRPLATLHVFLALEVHAETRWQWFAEADGWERSTCWPLSSWPLQSCCEQVPEAGLVCSVKSSISITRNRLDVDDHFAVQLVKSGQVDDEKNNAAEEHLVFISSI